MTHEEIELIAKWTHELWGVYLKFSQTVMNQWDFDRLLDELRRIYEESDQNDLILDMGLAFANDIERRQLNGTKPS